MIGKRGADQCRLGLGVANFCHDGPFGSSFNHYHNDHPFIGSVCVPLEGAHMSSA